MKKLDQLFTSFVWMVYGSLYPYAERAVIAASKQWPGPVPRNINKRLTFGPVTQQMPRYAGRRYAAHPSYARLALKGRQRGRYRIGGYYGRFRRGAHQMGHGYVELKFKDTSYAETALAATGTVLTSVNLIAQGVTENTRLGRKAVLKSLTLHGELTIGSIAGTTETSIYTFYVIQDRQANGAVSSVATAFENLTVNAFMNLANKDRYTILKRWHGTLNTQGVDVAGTGTLEFTKTLQWYTKLDLPIEFDSTTGAITEIRSNSITLMGFSTAGAVGFSGDVRVRFSD